MTNLSNTSTTQNDKVVFGGHTPTALYDDWWVYTLSRDAGVTHVPEPMSWKEYGSPGQLLEARADPRLIQYDSENIYLYSGTGYPIKEEEYDKNYWVSMRSDRFLRRYQSKETSVTGTLPVARYLTGLVQYQTTIYIVMGYSAALGRNFQDTWKLERDTSTYCPYITSAHGIGWKSYRVWFHRLTLSAFVLY